MVTQKSPLSRLQRGALLYLAKNGGQLPAYRIRAGSYAVTQTTRDSLTRRGFMAVARVHPLRDFGNKVVMAESAQITKAGLKALDWPDKGGPHWADMLAVAEQNALAEHEMRHPAARDYRDGFAYRLCSDPGTVLGGMVSNVGDAVEVDFCIDVHERGLAITLSDAEAQHLSGTIAAAWSAARTHSKAATDAQA